MKERPQVSSIVLSYDAVEYTKLCVESLRDAKTNIPFELIVVDNNSTEDTKEYIRNIDAIKYFSAVNLGVAGGRNMGFSLSSKSADFVCYLDNDVVVSDYWVDEFVDVMRSDPQVGIIGASSNVRVLQVASFTKDLRTEWFEFCNQNPKLLPREQLEQFYPQGFLFLANQERTDTSKRRLQVQMPPDYIPGWCQFFRKQAVSNMLTPMDPEYPLYSASDIDLSWSIAKNGYKAIYDEKVFIHHFKGQSAIARDPQELTNDALIGYARLSKKWSNEIISYLNSTLQKSRKKPETLSYMSSTMVRYLAEFFGFFTQEYDGEWILNEGRVNRALSGQN